jgi:DNA polymerase-3 subunit alpha
MSGFVHLHVHTQYSLLDGAIRLESLIDRATQFGMKHVAITDHGTMFGTVEFYEKCHKAGIQPIIGCECYVAPRTIADRSVQDNRELRHLILLAENEQGYRNLCKMASIAQLEGFYYKPRIDKFILEAHSQGLIALSACLHGEIPRLILDNRMDAAADAVEYYQRLFGEGRFFLEVQNNGMDVQETVNQALREIGGRLSVPLVATNDCHYLDSEDVRAHDVLLCIQTGKTIHDTERLKFRTDQLYFKSPEEMETYFRGYPHAVEHTAGIAERCRVEFDFKTYHFPRYSVPDETLSADDLFERRVRKGFEKRWEQILQRRPDADIREYRDRLEYEIQVIRDMGFPGYFLIVSDFIHYAKSHDIPVGPGRGSAAGSLVAYSLFITDLDPLEHGLLFERFLNPARKSMPDIDVDFCINGREKVYQYVVDRYGGGEYVSQIITFGKLKTRAVIRDVGRALDIPLREVDAIAKMVPDVLNISLDGALKQEPKLAELVETRPDVADLISICRVLEGLPRHASTHAAGVVISDRPLVDYLPLFRGKKGEVITQFDMKCVEKIGLVKFDFLGLRNLTVMEHALEFIRAQGKTPPDISNLDLTDPLTYRLLVTGDTTGVFQLESSGMKDLMVRLKPESFADIVALVALYRPGPLDSGMVDYFVDCKHGRKPVHYLVPELEPILRETYGVIVYQEQVMKIAVALASYTMSEADDLRKAMGKKIPEILARHRDRFVEGAVNKGIPADRAGQLFDLIEKFGGYGFNKSHSAAYALISFQTAYLKAHFPVEFLAALLTSEMNSTEGVVKFVAECRRHHIDLLPPDVNESQKGFTVSANRIRFGLLAVKNVGESAIDAVIEARKTGPFTSIYDFCNRVEPKKVNKRVIESLIKCGVFDSTGAYRAQLMEVLEEAMSEGQRTQKKKLDPQMGLFSFFSSPENEPADAAPALPDIPEWDEKTRLAYEKECLGFYLTGHPLQGLEPILTKFTNADALSVLEMSDGDILRMGGVIRSVKTIRTKRDDLMAFVTLEDMNGSLELTVFSSLYAAVSELLVEDCAVLVQGKIEKDEETWTATIHLHMDRDRTDRDMMVRLKSVLERHPGTCRCYIHLRDARQVETVIEVPEALNVQAGPDLERDVTGLLGYSAVRSVCSPIVAAASSDVRGNGKKWEKRR